MAFQKRLLFVSAVLLQLVILTKAQINFIQHYCNFAYQSNYTSNSVFRKNLDTLPSSLSSSSATFYNFSLGLNPDKVNVIALCRGDVTPDICRSCLNDSDTMLRQLCPREKESIGWSDNCMLRYSDRDIFNTVNTLPNAYAYNLQKASNVNQLNQVVKTLLNGLKGVAARGGSVMKFATGNMSVGSDDMTIYGLVQCTPDLSVKQCEDCLNMTFGLLPNCCDGKIGGRVVTPSCNFRYEIGRFYNETVLADAPPPQASAAAPLPPHSPLPLLSPTSENGGRTKECVLTLSAIAAAAMTAILFF